jgi:hypothetical protein
MALQPELTIARLEREWGKALSAEVHLLILTPEKIRTLAKSDKPFYRSFAKNAIVLEGAGYDKDL